MCESREGKREGQCRNSCASSLLARLYALFIFLFNPIYLDVYSAGRFSERRIQVDCWGETRGPFTVDRRSNEFALSVATGTRRKIFFRVIYRSCNGIRSARGKLLSRLSAIFSLSAAVHTYVGTSRRLILEAIDWHFRMLELFGGRMIDRYGCRHASL